MCLHFAIPIQLNVTLLCVVYRPLMKGGGGEGWLRKQRGVGGGCRVVIELSPNKSSYRGLKETALLLPTSLINTVYCISIGDE